MIFLKLKLNNTYIEIKEAKTFYERMMGFMGKTNINYGILFPKCNSIHTFFMKEEIDVIGLNEKNEIIFIERNCTKNKIIKINHSIKILSNQLHLILAHCLFYFLLLWVYNVMI